MTRPTDANLARAFWAIFERERDYDDWHKLPALAFTVMVQSKAAEFDAESPAGTARGSEEVMQSDGSEPRVSEPVARGEEGKTSPLSQNQLFEMAKSAEARRCAKNRAAKLLNTCTRPTCRAEMRPGLRCSSPHCGLKETTK